MTMIKQLLSQCDGTANSRQTVVAYKGGHVEKDLLNKLNIPCLNLETWGCPKCPHCLLCPE